MANSTQSIMRNRLCFSRAIYDFEKIALSKTTRKLLVNVIQITRKSNTCILLVKGIHLNY